MISIVIPALNEEKYIGILLEHIVTQDIAEDIEIVVSDAGSTDKTLDIIRDYQIRYPRLSVVKGGLPAIARNNGARASSGDPIFFIDADMTIPDKTFLSRAVAYFRSHAFEIATVYLRPDSDYWFDHLMVSGYNLWLPISRFIRPSGSMCIVASRDMFNKSKGYPEDEIMNEDHDFIYACSKIGRFGIIPLYLVFSIRRFNKEGRARLLFKYAVSAIYLVLVGPIKKPIFKYEFGNFKDTHEKRKK